MFDPESFVTLSWQYNYLFYIYLFLFYSLAIDTSASKYYSLLFEQSDYI